MNEGDRRTPSGLMTDRRFVYVRLGVRIASDREILEPRDFGVVLSIDKLIGRSPKRIRLLLIEADGACEAVYEDGDVSVRLEIDWFDWKGAPAVST